MISRSRSSSSPVFVILFFFLAAAVLVPAAASAQPPDTAQIDRAIHERWRAVLADVAREHGTPLDNGALTGGPEVKRVIYREVLERLADDPALRQLAVPDLSLVDAQTPARERAFIDDLTRSVASQSQPKSLNAAATNSAAGRLAEKSGFTELIALALNSQNVVSADASAVSFNLSALALYSLADPDVYSELHRYQQHALLRRVGGTVVFGAKVPEKEITGISGIPSADTLFDVFTWDVKVRVAGDKDPRARKWYEETLGRQAMLNQLVVVQADVPPNPEDLSIVTAALEEMRGARLARLKARINRSPQLTLKAAGTHLTKEAGPNTYTFGLLFDQGFGASRSLTANVLYSIADDVRMEQGEGVRVNQLTLSGAHTAQLAPDALVAVRAVDWSAGATVNLFTNRGSLPMPLDHTWRLFTSFEIPVTAAASIPVSVVFTNDANELQKTKYMSGFVGISYDFSAVGKLFGTRESGAP
jgi:hypothetical protein